MHKKILRSISHKLDRDKHSRSAARRAAYRRAEIKLKRINKGLR